jgi:lipooligosaccharide transport system permease protein
VLFLLAMGIGLGAFVDRGAGSAALGGVPYVEFLAPALLVSTVMQGSVFEATFPILAGFHWIKRFHAMYATPLSPRDIALGNLLWTAFRLAMIATVFAVIVVILGAAASPAIVLGVPIAVLTGMSFAAPIAAFSATQRTPARFNVIFRFIITPLFLFSGVFFPIDTLPTFLHAVVWLSPLWHGVVLSRALVLGVPEMAPALVFVHLSILVAFVAVGTVAAVILIERRLVRG